MHNLLLIDDDIELSDMLGDYLRHEGYAITHAASAETGLQEALSGRHALVVLDVMLPGRSGIEVLSQIRQRTALPVLMLTARGDDMDRIVGLELGADDYVPKPCQPRELAARIRAILRRTQPSTPQQEALCVGALTLRPASRSASWGGCPLELTSTEFNLLEHLARHAGQTVSKSVLSEAALGRPLTRYDRSIDVHLSSIRAKIGPMPDGRSCIQTVFRQGYQLIPE
ncbi:response regulator transcription factor [Dechloromonas sp. ZS-1]|uniref:response regulator transcription factor n=1 Tax=Dechloromonas sp. ZS-1 TaxID=3138067 RepID=UPI0031FC08FB